MRSAQAAEAKVGIFYRKTAVSQLIIDKSTAKSSIRSLAIPAKERYNRNKKTIGRV